jgi:hypothetical protein
MHIKNKNDFEKESKQTKKLGKIAFWTQETAKSFVYGYVIFCVCFFTTDNTKLSLFLGIFTAYLIIGRKITEVSKNIKFIFDFWAYNLKLAVTMIIISIVGMLFFSTITLITWPLMLSGLLLFIGATLGIRGVNMHKYYKNS